MAHWAEIDENNKVLRVTVGSNDDPDEGYQWLIDNLGGTWIKTSYNTYKGQHSQGGTPLRGNFAGIDYIYDPILDIFLPPKPYPSWIINEQEYDWMAPIPKPTSGFYLWSEKKLQWVQVTDSGMWEIDETTGELKEINE